MAKKFALIVACLGMTSAQGVGINQVSQQQQQKLAEARGMRVIAPGIPVPTVQPPRTVSTAAPKDSVTIAGRDAGAGATSADPEVAYTYDAVGNRDSATYKNGVVVLFQYDRRNRLVDLHASRNGVLIHHYHYTLDASGLRTRVDANNTDGSSNTTTFGYDAVKRLTDESQSAGGVASFTAHYDYDKVGNRMRAVVNGVSTVYTYDANDRLTSETTTGGPLAGTTLYTHDGAGNVLTKDGPLGHIDYVYNTMGRLVEVRDGSDVVEYEYDFNGLMTGKTWTPTIGEPVRWQYHWDTARDVPQTIEEMSATGAGTFALEAKYVFGDGLITETRGQETRYVITDGFGDTRALVDSGGAITDTFAYDAWGNTVGRTGNTPTTYLYRGERLDPNLGFYYLRARWMDPTVGRFTQMDDFQGDAQAPPSLHKYLYADGDPVNRIDPTGHASASLSEVGVAVSVAAIIALGSKVLIDQITRPSSGGQREYGVWDAMALTQFRATQTRAEEDSNTTIEVLAASTTYEHGHHTIPVYLCGSMDQDTSDVTVAQHLAIHAEIAAVRVALAGAEAFASKMLGRNRSIDILRIAQTRVGRESIASALYQVYRVGGWLPRGTPSIGTVFEKERPQFEKGKTSLPWCSRKGLP